jgi:hypothetical protein
MQESSSPVLRPSDVSRESARVADSSQRLEWQTSALLEQLASHIPANIQAERLLRTVLLHMHRFTDDQIADPVVI